MDLFGDDEPEEGSAGCEGDCGGAASATLDAAVNWLDIVVEVNPVRAPLGRAMCATDLPALGEWHWAAGGRHPSGRRRGGAAKHKTARDRVGVRLLRSSAVPADPLQLIRWRSPCPQPGDNAAAGVRRA